jgi:hypothetical protein
MPLPRRRLALTLGLLLLPACSDGGGGSASATVGATNPTGVTSASGTDAGTSTGSGSASASASASGSASEATSAGTGSDSQDSLPTGTSDPGVTTSGATSTGGVDPWTSSSGGADTFADTGAVCKMQIDIVFVMDVSTSMLALLQKLEDEILTVDAKLKSLDVLPDIHYGLVVFVDDTQIINGGAPYADVQTLKQDFNKWWNFTQSNSQVNGGGSNGDWPENSIDALFTAAGAFQWRPMEQTLRMVIHCTDDTFGEKGAVQSGIAIQHTYDETVKALQDRQVRVFAFADNDMTGGPGENEDVSMGFFTPYKGKTPIPDATDGGAFNINLVLANQLSLNAAINDSVEASLCQDYIPQ